MTQRALTATFLFASTMPLSKISLYINRLEPPSAQDGPGMLGSCMHSYESLFGSQVCVSRASTLVCDS